MKTQFCFKLDEKFELWGDKIQWILAVRDQKDRVKFLKFHSSLKDLILTYLELSLRLEKNKSMSEFLQNLSEAEAHLQILSEKIEKEVMLHGIKGSNR